MITGGGGAWPGRKRLIPIGEWVPVHQGNTLRLLATERAVATAGGGPRRWSESKIKFRPRAPELKKMLRCRIYRALLTGDALEDVCKLGEEKKYVFHLQSYLRTRS